jgi:hypothetical protein
MDDLIVQEFQDGVNAYWAGGVPEDWQDEDRRATSPYLQGWYMASMWETSAGWLTDEAGDPLQDED